MALQKEKEFVALLKKERAASQAAEHSIRLIERKLDTLSNNLGLSPVQAPRRGGFVRGHASRSFNQWSMNYGKKKSFESSSHLENKAIK